MPKNKNKQSYGDDTIVTKPVASSVTEGMEKVVNYGTAPKPTDESNEEAKQAEEKKEVTVEVNIASPTDTAQNVDNAPSTETQPADNAPNGENVQTKEVPVAANTAANTEVKPAAELEVKSDTLTLDSIDDIEKLRSFILSVLTEYLQSTQGDEAPSKENSAENSVIVENKASTEPAAKETKADECEQPIADEDLPNFEEVEKAVEIITPEVSLSKGDAKDVRGIMVSTITKYRKINPVMDGYIRSFLGSKYGDSLHKLSNSMLTGVFRTVRDYVKENDVEKYQFINSSKIIGDSKVGKIKTAKDLAELYKNAHKH